VQYGLLVIMRPEMARIGSCGLEGRARLQHKKRYEDIEIGDRSSFAKTITEADIFAFCGITGDFNPVHVDEAFARQSRWEGRIVHGMLVASMVTQTLSALLGDGSIHVSQEVFFEAPVRVGDTVTVVSEITEKREEKRRAIVSSEWTNQDGTTVITGKGELLLPREK
jgi:3-hydroxybutyryl-CoA dehydratase